MTFLVGTHRENREHDPKIQDLRRIPMYLQNPMYNPAASYIINPYGVRRTAYIVRYMGPSIFQQRSKLKISIEIARSMYTGTRLLPVMLANVSVILLVSICLLRAGLRRMYTDNHPGGSDFEISPNHHASVRSETSLNCLRTSRRRMNAH